MTIFEYLVGAISISLFGLNFRNDLCQVSAYLAQEPLNSYLDGAAIQKI